MQRDTQTVRLKITMAYQGTDFEGWQLQAGSRPARTVQGCLEEALTTLAQVPVRAHGSARTDSGVHALEQVAHADVPIGRAGLPWRRALDALVPRDMAILEATAAPSGFHARFDALGKRYAYTLWTNSRFVIPQRRQFIWQTGELNVDEMRKIAEILAGRHDFAAFANSGSDVRDTVRNVTSIRTRDGQFPDELVFEFEGEGFLKQMVRNLMGTMVAAGRGKVNAEDVRSCLEMKDRTRLPATAPAQGLCLERVFYGDCGDRRLVLGHPSPGEPDGERDRCARAPDLTNAGDRRRPK
ncbi:MAG: tRNA pseudouridine(38-40) synthase TruA [Desulfovibrionaceae bacterium]|nr:tRNA pseudouridine(38-40) synthase TruA [Desulfovibrionaceae bacterium]MBF0512445.1 tRNA pseudouridine(38-40) synthase TruA [Desulfovibrionaceae bacterium]